MGKVQIELLLDELDDILGKLTVLREKLRMEGYYNDELQ